MGASSDVEKNCFILLQLVSYMNVRPFKTLSAEMSILRGFSGKSGDGWAFQESLAWSTLILGRPESYLQHKPWVVPRITDYSQARFFLDIQNCVAINIALKQLQAFALKPLALIKLENYVSYLTRSQVGQPHVS